MHDLDKEFDLKLRSALDGVEEEVPQRVWEGVSSRVGRRGTRVAWMRWACAGLAAAAAVALAVVFSGTSDLRTDCTAPARENLVAEVPDSPAMQEEDVMESASTCPHAVPSAAVRRPEAVANAAAACMEQPQPEEVIPAQVSRKLPLPT